MGDYFPYIAITFPIETHVSRANILSLNNKDSAL